jgi:hypothetical protein
LDTVPKPPRIQGAGIDDPESIPSNRAIINCFLRMQPRAAVRFYPYPRQPRAGQTIINGKRKNVSMQHKTRMECKAGVQWGAEPRIRNVTTITITVLYSHKSQSTGLYMFVVPQNDGLLLIPVGKRPRI